MMLSPCNQIISNSIPVLRGMESAPVPSYLNFGGGDEYLALTSTEIYTGEFSISFWIQITAGAGAYVCGSGTKHYISFPTTSSAEFLMNNVSDTLSFNSKTNLAGDKWTHIVITKDGANTIKLYFNGVSQSDTASIAQEFRVGILGARSGAAGYTAQKLDHILLFNTAISQANVTTLYGGGTPETAGDPGEMSGLRVYYTLNDVSNFPTIPDSSGNNNHGTCNNMESEDLVAY